jgi:AcrR family transcriptional regulator
LEGAWDEGNVMHEASSIEAPPTSTAATATAGDPQRERIVSAALEILAVGGIAALTMRSIGDRVGLHNSSLFHHFASKREIVAAVLGRVNDGLVTLLSRLDAEREPALETLLTVAVALSDHYAAHRAEARCAMRLLLDPDALGDARGRRFTTILWGWLARAQASGAIRPVSVAHAARNLLGVLLMDPIWAAHAARDARDDARRRDELVTFIEGALAPRQQPGSASGS